MTASLKYIDDFSEAQPIRQRPQKIRQRASGVGTGLTVSEYMLYGGDAPQDYTSNVACDAGLGLTFGTLANYQVMGRLLWNPGSLTWPAASPLSHEQNVFSELSKAARARANLDCQIETRVAELRDLAAEEGQDFNERSKACLLGFLEALNFAVAPKIFLLDGGIFRAIWRSSDEQVGLEFMENGVIRYVFFAARPQPVQVARSAGIDDHSHILEQIQNMGLSHLLTNG